MRLSFVIPAYNEEKYIGKCLNSIFKELRDAPYDAEIIVVNNASTDRTREIAAGYPDVMIIDEPKKGLLWARRAGFLASTGDLIANVDADTILTPHWIKKVFEEFSKDQGLVALSGPFIYYDLPKSVQLLARAIFYPISYVTYFIIHDILRSGAILQGGNYIVRRGALEKIGGYDTNINFYGEDTDIAMRISKVGKVKFTYSLPMYSSGRRIAKEGMFTMGIRYGANFLSMFFFKTPASKRSTDIRPEEGGILKHNPIRKFREWTIASITIIILSAIIAGLGFGIYKLAQLGIVIVRLIFLNK